MLTGALRTRKKNRAVAFTAALLALVLSLSLVPIQPAEAKSGTSLQATSLTVSSKKTTTKKKSAAALQKANKKLIEKAIKAGGIRKTTVSKTYRISKAQAKKLLAAYSANKNMYWRVAYGYAGGVVNKVSKNGQAVQYYTKCWMTAKEAKQARQAAKKLAAKARKASKTRRGQVQYVHDYLVKNTAYATAKNAPNKKMRKELLYTAYGPLVKGRAYCAGYSAAFALTMTYLGIPVRCVDGTTSSTGKDHRWNEVKIGGKWLVVDTTWDDPMSASHRDYGKKRVYHDYMLKTRAQVAKADKKFYGCSQHKIKKVTMVTVPK